MSAKRIMVLILAVLLITAALGSCAPKDDRLTSNLGLVMNNIAEYDGWIYYSLFVNGDLYKIKPNGKSKTSLNGIIAGSFAIYKDRIYFSNMDDENNIYSAKLDGSDMQIFIDENWSRIAEECGFETGINKIDIAGDWIYYKTRNSTLCRVRTDGTEGEIFGFCIEYGVNDEWVYWIGTDGKERVGWHLFNMRHDGTEKNQYKHIESWQIDCDDNWIYYQVIGDSDIYKQSFDQSQIIKLADNEGGAGTCAFKLIGDWVYYQNKGEEPGLYKVKTDGSEKIKITDDENAITFLDVWDNWLIYLSENRLEPESKYICMVRISNDYKTDELVNVILTEMASTDIEIHKYE